MTLLLNELVRFIPVGPALNLLVNAAALSGICALAVLAASRVSTAAKSTVGLLALLSLLALPSFFMISTLCQAMSETPAPTLTTSSALVAPATPTDEKPAPTAGAPIQTVGAAPGWTFVLPKINFSVNPHLSAAVACAVAIIMLIALALIVRLAYAIAFLAGYRQGLRCLNSDPAVSSILRETADFLGCKSTVRVYSSPTLSSPVCTGLFFVAVVVPEKFAQRIDREELRCILLHELAHAKSADHLVGLLQRVATALYWWNPLVYFVSDSYSQSREELCDTQAILGLASPRKYAQALVSIAEKTVLASRLPATVGMASSRVSLEARVRSILTKERDMRIMSTVPARVVLSVTAVGIVALFSSVRAVEVESSKASTTAQVAPSRSPSGPPWHVTDPIGDSATIYESAWYAKEIEKCELSLRSFRRNPEKAGATLFALAGLYLDRERSRLLGLRDKGAPEGTTVPDYSAALTRYESLVRDYPSFERNDRALYRIAWIHMCEDREQQRSDALLRLVRDFPSSPLANQAAFDLADASFSRQDYTRAYEFFSKVKPGDIQPPLGEMAHYRMGECLLRLGDIKKAGEVFTAHVLACDTGGYSKPMFSEMAQKSAGECAAMLKHDGQNVFQK